MVKVYLKIRRLVDVVLSIILLIALAPVFAFVSLSILVMMGKPIFFRQTRQGHKGTFQIIKFRTMIKNADRIGGGYYSPDIQLVPPLGALLRKVSLDEIPQLLNILKGDMSFVGPRPALPTQVERYTEEQMRRLAVPQGITGLAQLRYRNNAPWSVRIESDLEYVDSISPRMDLQILAATPLKVLRSSGVRMDQTAEEVDDLGRGVQDGGKQE
ncbi:MAG: sugar transferase [Candidatus Saccharibacteria bacterium]|nr:sugar transferase [Candidatus Saccharibacteria bacterium]